MTNHSNKSHWLLRDKQDEPVGVGLFTDVLIECHVFSFLELEAERISEAQYETYIVMGSVIELPPEYISLRIFDVIR